MVEWLALIVYQLALAMSIISFFYWKNEMMVQIAATRPTNLMKLFMLTSLLKSGELLPCLGSHLY